MAEINPPYVISDDSNTAEEFRQTLASLTKGEQGVFLQTDMKVTEQAVPDMSVLISSGSAIVVGTEASLQGSYHCVNDGDVTLTISAADVALIRYDRIVVQVEDVEYSGGVDAWTLVVVEGSAGGGEPSLPDNCLELALVTVAAGVTSIINSAITDRRTFIASYDHTVATSGTRPSTPKIGDDVFETDTKRVSVWDGSQWRPISNIKYLSASATTTYMVQAGVASGTLNGSSNLSVSFPTAFPNSIIAVVPTISAGAGLIDAKIVLRSGATTSGFTVGINKASDNTSLSGSTVGVDWVAYGT